VATELCSLAQAASELRCYAEFYVWFPGVRFLTEQSGFLAICPVKTGDQTGQAFVRFLVLLCIVLHSTKHSETLSPETSI